MANVKAWKFHDPCAPAFPSDYEIARKAVLQVTDIKTNRNKYYAIELHIAKSGKGEEFRVFTHYGRTDDLESNPDSRQKECRFFNNRHEAEANYMSIYNEKTSPRKGYKELSLASSSIGSAKARGTSTGMVDEKTLERIAAQEKEKNQPKKPVAKASPLNKTLQEFVRYIYDEATNALTTTVQAKITARGIETPLGILTVGQIEKGESILADLYAIFQKKRMKNRQEALEQLSSDFYTAIPHRFGRSRQHAAAAVIDSLPAFEQKQETLQLMKDMLQVNGEEGNVLFDAAVDQEFKALNCDMQFVDPGSDEFKKVEKYVIESQVKSKKIKVQNVFTVRRNDEVDIFRKDITPQRELFHGSRIQNWVGLLSRGILMPKLVVSMGVHRTDAGWLGNGIYFGDAACTSSFYTTPGKRKTRVMAIANVALGKAKQFTKITYGLNAPPDGYDSCHGVRRKMLAKSEFDDDEYVIYNTNQQHLKYLVEFTA